MIAIHKLIIQELGAYNGNVVGYEQFLIRHSRKSTMQRVQVGGGSGSCDDTKIRRAVIILCHDSSGHAVPFVT